MSSYPNLVKRFQNTFHIDIHGEGSAISLQEMHDFIEVRNVIVHSSGTASKQYYERMSVYEEKPLLENALESPEPNFSWLFDFSQRLAAHCMDIDSKVEEKWF